MPEYPVPLLRRDLLNTLGPSIFLGQGKVQEGRALKQRMYLLVAPDDPTAGHQNIPQDITQENREQVDPIVWDTSVPGRTKCVPPIEIRLRPGEKYSGKRQYLLMPEAPRGIQIWDPLLTKFLKHRLIRPCQSPCNTPILPIQSLTGNIGLCKT